MQKKLHLLETFHAQGQDGRDYTVYGYEHLVRDESLSTGLDLWEPTGQSEYRLADGRPVDLLNDGSIRIH
jgi:hypothetical protein